MATRYILMATAGFGYSSELKNYGSAIGKYIQDAANTLRTVSITGTPYYILKFNSDLEVPDGIRNTYSEHSTVFTSKIFTKTSLLYYLSTFNVLPVYTWTSLTTSPAFVGKDGIGMISFGGYMYLIGGWNPYLVPVLTKEVWRSQDGITWTRLADAPWTGRHAFGLIEWQNKIWLYGGDYSTDIWSFDGTTWTEEVNNCPALTNRRGSYIGVHDNNVWIIGGVGDSDMLGRDEVYSSTDGRTFTQVGTIPIAMGKVHGRLPSFEGKMWIIGGCVLMGFGGGGEQLHDHHTEIYSSVDGVTWALESTGNWTGRVWQDVTVFDNKLWAIGGWTTVNTKNVYSSYDGVVWEHMTVSFQERHAASLCVFNGSLYMAAGNLFDSGNQTKADCWRMSIS